MASFHEGWGVSGNSAMYESTSNSIVSDLFASSLRTCLELFGSTVGWFPKPLTTLSASMLRTFPKLLNGKFVGWISSTFVAAPTLRTFPDVFWKFVADHLQTFS